jgi:hypothetical protein
VALASACIMLDDLSHAFRHNGFENGSYMRLTQELNSHDELSTTDWLRSFVISESRFGNSLLLAAIDSEINRTEEEPHFVVMANQSVSYGRDYSRTIIDRFSRLIYEDVERSEQLRTGLREMFQEARRVEESEESFAQIIALYLGVRSEFSGDEEAAFEFIAGTLRNGYCEVIIPESVWDPATGMRMNEGARSSGERIEGIEDVRDERLLAEVRHRFGISGERQAEFVFNVERRLLQDQLAFLHAVDIDAFQDHLDLNSGTQIRDAVVDAYLERAELGEDHRRTEQRRLSDLNEDIRRMFDQHGVLRPEQMRNFIAWISSE